MKTAEWAKATKQKRKGASGRGFYQKVDLRGQPGGAEKRKGGIWEGLTGRGEGTQKG